MTFVFRSTDLALEDRLLVARRAVEEVTTGGTEDQGPNRSHAYTCLYLYLTDFAEICQATMITMITMAIGVGGEMRGAD